MLILKQWWLRYEWKGLWERYLHVISVYKTAQGRVTNIQLKNMAMQSFAEIKLWCGKSNQKKSTVKVSKRIQCYTENIVMEFFQFGLQAEKNYVCN